MRLLNFNAARREKNGSRGEHLVMMEFFKYQCPAKRKLAHFQRDAEHMTSGALTHKRKTRLPKNAAAAAICILETSSYLIFCDLFLGERGESGVDGKDGLRGLPGKDGLPGLLGEKGDTGDRGFIGLQGPAGVIGPPVSYTIFLLDQSKNEYFLGCVRTSWTKRRRWLVIINK